MNKADVYRAEIGRLIRMENSPKCRYDGLACERFGECGSFEYGCGSREDWCSRIPINKSEEVLNE